MLFTSVWAVLPVTSHLHKTKENKTKKKKHYNLPQK